MTDRGRPGRLKSIFIKIAASLLVLAVLAAAGFLLYVRFATRQAEAAFLAMIEMDENISITEESGYFLLEPSAANPGSIPIIYYPGGLVAPEAYLYKMGRVSLCLQKPVYIIKAPFNAAIFDINAAGRIMARYNLEQARVGGHSLGGISACRYAAQNPEKVFQLFLFGSYCDRDVAGFTGPVTSVMGLKDRIIDWDNYRAAKANLPAGAIILEVEGLNHSAFGNYGLQVGDGPAGLTDREIIEIICSVFSDYGGDRD